MDDEPQVDPVVPVDAPEPASTSILDDLRAMRERKAQGAGDTVVFNVPSYSNALAVRYRYPAGGYQAAIQAAEIEFASKSPDAKIDGNADLLIACCASVLGRRKDGTLIDLLTDRPLADGELADPPLRFDSALAQALQIDVPPEVRRKGRFIVRHVFSPRAATTGVYDGDLALIAQGNRVYAWLAGTSRDLDDEFAGE